MGHFLLSAETSFSAAHTLPGVDMCARMHGHNWRVQVTVQVGQGDLDAAGMGVDFRVLEQLTRDAVHDFEHRYLNDLEPFGETPPSAERIARVVHDRVAARLDQTAPAARIVEVALWEMPQYRVIYRPQ